jgi:hypothetical protein
MPPVPVDGVPLNRPVASLNETPLGNAPLSEKVGAGRPLAVTLKLPFVPAVNVVAFALVKAGAALTISVKV